VDERDVSLRRRTYAFFVEHARAPVAAELGDPEEVLAGWRRLHAEHAVVLNGSAGELRMLNPFSVVPTAYRVRGRRSLVVRELRLGRLRDLRGAPR
jgi:hypothetical protein